MKKFELTANTRVRFGRVLHQIKALVSFDIVRAGDLGGYVEKESNLSHDGNAWVFDNAEVFGDARVFGNARVFGDAEVSGDADWMIVGPIGSRDAITTFYRRNDGAIMVVCGCFHGTLAEFEEKVSETHEDNEHAMAYRAAVQLAKIRMNREAV